MALQFQVWQPSPTSADQRLAQHGYPLSNPGDPTRHAAGRKALSQRTPIVGPPPSGPRATQRQFQYQVHGEQAGGWGGGGLSLMDYSA